MSSGKLQESLPTSSAETEDKLNDEETDSSLLELTRKVGEKEDETKVVDEDLTIPPNNPQSGISILAHKIWIGNLDKRLSQ